MGREVASVAAFRSTLPPHGRNNLKRRSCTRRLPVLVLVLAGAFALVSLVRRSNAREREDLALNQEDGEAADKAMLDLIVRTKEAIQAETPMEDIAAYADRTRVLYVSPAFRTPAPEKGTPEPRLDRNSTSLAKSSTRRIRT